MDSSASHYPLPTLEQLRLGREANIGTELWNRIASDVRNALAKNTIDARRSAYREIEAYSCEHPFPWDAPTAAIFYNQLANRTHSSGSLHLRFILIGEIHEFYGLPSPNTMTLVRNYLFLLRKTRRPVQKKNAFLLDMLRQTIRLCDRDPYPQRGDRDRALLTLLYFSAMRGAEVAALRSQDVSVVNGRLRIHIRKSKMDQLGEGRTINIPPARDPHFCPVTIVADFMARYPSTYVFPRLTRHRRINLDSALTTAGMLFIVKRIASQLGLDPSLFGVHSTRAGFVTDSFERRIPPEVICQTTLQAVATLDGYRRNHQVSLNTTELLFGE